MKGKARSGMATARGGLLVEKEVMTVPAIMVMFNIYSSSMNIF